MSKKPTLTVTGTRLQQQGLLFLQHSRDAGEAFLADTQGAGLDFGEQLSAAGQRLLDQLGSSASGLGLALRKEASLWWALAVKTRDAYTENWVGRVETLESKAQELMEARTAISPAAFETRVWKTAHDLLARAQSFVEARLEETGKPTTRKPLAVVPQSPEKAPIRNYDQLTARDVVRRIQRLSGPQATAVLDYEKGRKNRATVIRAAKQKLAAV